MQQIQMVGNSKAILTHVHTQYVSGSNTLELKYNLSMFLGVAALSFAASKGHLEIVRILIQHGALVNAVDHSDSSALVAAAKNGHLDVVGHLVSNCEWSTDSVHDLGSYIFAIMHHL